MKKIAISILSFALILAGCEEISPSVDLENEIGAACPQRNYQASAGPSPDKKVLIEEFTGVRCVNCPAGSAAIQSLISANNGRLIAVSVHNGIFSAPYPASTQDLTFMPLPIGNSFANYVGPVLSYPAAVIDRKLFAGSNDRVLGQAQWASKIAEQLALPAQAGLSITKSYNSSSRELSVTVDSRAYAAFDKQVFLTVFITEDSVVSAQLEPSIGVNNNYAHKHVLRKILTDYKGLPLCNLPSSNTFTATLPSLWRSEHCSIIALLHKGDVTGNNLEVLQAEEVHVE